MHLTIRAHINSSSLHRLSDSPSHKQLATHTVFWIGAWSAGQDQGFCPEEETCSRFTLQLHTPLLQVPFCAASHVFILRDPLTPELVRGLQRHGTHERERKGETEIKVCEKKAAYVIMEAGKCQTLQGESATRRLGRADGFISVGRPGGWRARKSQGFSVN